MNKDNGLRRLLWSAAFVLVIGPFNLLGSPLAAAQQSTLRVVMHSDLKILDPIWTTAYITRNHGYMIYDTLFAVDADDEIRPQMVEEWSVSPDQLVWTFKLREGLLFHDGQPVTAEDVVASLRRWAARDAIGTRLMNLVSDLAVVDEQTFRLSVTVPTGLVLVALGKPSSNVPFIMPRRVAETPPNEQIAEYVGSGPFVFKQDEWSPGDRVVYVRFDGYRPRDEPASGLAGGKVVKVDRVEWRAVPDQQTAINALVAGEVDMVEAPMHDLLPVAARSPDVRFVDWNPRGNQFSFRFNVLHKPFDDPKIRQALFYAFNQEDFLKAVVGDPAYYSVCKSIYPCGTSLETEAGMEDKLTSNMRRARELLEEAGYDGTPILLMHSTDLAGLTNLAPVAKSLMERAGLKVDMQSMDWQSVVARRVRKDPPSEGGWHGLFTYWATADVMNPIDNPFLDASCDTALFGWPCDEETELLRDAFARATDPAEQKELATRLQLRLVEYPILIHLGQWRQPAAMRRNVDGMLTAPAPVFWNIEKAGR